jgi:hypothetical protein
MRIVRNSDSRHNNEEGRKLSAPIQADYAQVNVVGRTKSNMIKSSSGTDP